MKIQSIRSAMMVSCFLSLAIAPLNVSYAHSSAGAEEGQSQSDDDNCTKVSFLRRTTSQTRIAAKTKTSRTGKDVPTGSLKSISISGGKQYIYTKWSNLKVKEYDFKVKLFDPDGKIVLKRSNKIKNSFSATDGTWTTWVNWNPKKIKETGNYRLVICEGGIRQVEKVIKVVM